MIIRLANKPTTFPVLRINSLPCYVKKSGIRDLLVCFERLDKYREPTFAVETAAKIILANPNSAEDTPAA